jgi:4-hydroxy-3-methylbut-2-en-1-yl diphosphate synthase IspG/GcpE
VFAWNAAFEKTRTVTTNNRAVRSLAVYGAELVRVTSAAAAAAAAAIVAACDGTVRCCAPC